MAYEAPITIKKAIDNIRKRKYVLPSIQREFVWEPDQIEKLFDSLMRNYPISTFLFWKVDKTRIKDFQFYEFLKNYHGLNAKHNTKVDLGNDEDVIAILDGQQRMTSLYIALTGTHAKKLPYYSSKNVNAFPKKKLYLNLLSKSDNIELEYDFKFLSKEDIKESKNKFWFDCSDILDFTDVNSVMQYVIEHDLMNTSKFTQDQGKFASNAISKLFNVIHQEKPISFYLEESEELDKVLQIFIRINSGGTKLSYSDLLLSIATAQWKEKDAREIIHEFVDEINKIGEGFDFNKDLVLKTCLVHGDFSDIKFKVDNFTKENMAKIEQNWDSVSRSLKVAIELISKYGYNRNSLTASNALIPIAYFIYKNDLSDKIVHSQAQEQNRKAIIEWLSRTILRGTFGGTPDAIYPVMRNFINQNPNRFPLSEIIDHYRGKRKSISFTEDDIESILDLKYGKKNTFSALCLVYSSLNHSFKYHQDHIHPKSFFYKRKLDELGITDVNTKDEYISRFNNLSNLQLLEATTNIEKRDKPFEDWLEERYPNENDRNNYLSLNHIKNTQSLNFNDFIDFYKQRRLTLKKLYADILNVRLKETDKIQS